MKNPPTVREGDEVVVTLRGKATSVFTDTGALEIDGRHYVVTRHDFVVSVEVVTPQVDEALLRSTTDAAVWADEFRKVVPDADWGLMVTWFANAIETGRAAGREMEAGP